MRRPFKPHLRYSAGLWWVEPVILWGLPLDLAHVAAARNIAAWDWANR